jgi:hypothetical protein
MYESVLRFERRPALAGLERGFNTPPCFPISANYDSAPSAAIPLVADRVSLPSATGTVQLLDLLPPDLRSRYSSPSELFRPAKECKRAPKAVLCPPAEYLRLILRMKDAGMLHFTTKPAVVNGLFGVPKDDGSSIRLIIDARPANAVFIDPPPVSLPTPDVLVELQAKPGQQLWMAKADLDNFYHRIMLPEWMWPYFALPALESADLGLEGQFGACPLFPCCKTLPMGWSHSVFCAQVGHEYLLDSSTSLKAADRILPGGDRRIDRLRHSVYIDDLYLFSLSRRETDTALDEYTRVCHCKGIPVKPSKVVRATCGRLEWLGVEVDGTSHEIGVSPTKLQVLCQETERFLQHRFSSGHALARLVGKWTWAALLRRPALAVFSSVYRFIDSAKWKSYRIWASVQLELSIIMNIAPLLYWCLSAPWAPVVVATDASMDGQGVVATPMADSAVFEKVASDLSVPDHGNLPAVLDHVRWSTIVSSRWERPEHINVLEVRAVSTAVRWMLSYPTSVSRRLLVLSDSLVAVYATSKGRTSSPPLLRRLRSLSCLVLAAGLQLCLRWIRSANNPADEPSRRPSR